MSNFSDKLYKADINFSGSGDNTIIAAPSSGRIAVDFISVYPAAATTIQVKDGSTAYGGSYPLSAKQPFVFENTTEAYDGVITCSFGNPLVINSDTAVAVTGFVRYRLLDVST
jgi:hypothetical protein